MSESKFVSSSAKHYPRGLVIVVKLEIMAQLHADSVTDVATSSNFRQVRTSNIHLDLDVCFDKQTITGVERITFEVLQSGVKEGNVSDQTESQVELCFC